MKRDTRTLVEADAKQADKAKQAQAPADEHAKLMDELEAAKLAGNWKLLAAKAKQLADWDAKLETLQHEAKQNKLADVRELFQIAIEAAVQLVQAKLDDDVLVLMDGIWYSNDFANTEVNCHIIRKQASTRKQSSTGYGKKFAETTEQLLAKHGSELMDDSKLTYQQAYDAAKLVDITKSSSNASFGIRNKLTKKYGTPIS